MSNFNSFQDVLPDPNNTIGNAGQAAGTSGPGYASVELSSDNKTMRTRTNSGRLIARAAAYHSWSVNIGYNPMTRDDFERIYTFLIHKRGSLSPFFVSLPQYRVPRHATFANFIGTSQANNLEAAGTTLAGATSALIGRSNYVYTSHGTPKVGDLFNVDGANSNHKKAYMVTRVETNADYLTGSVRPSTAQVRIHFTPGLAKQVGAGDDFKFYNPLVKVVLANDIQQYSLGTNGLYQFGLQLEEVQ
jgi:hypothetical protein